MSERVEVRNERGMYRVYKLIQETWVLKKTFYTLHQANRYVKGFKRNRKS